MLFQSNTKFYVKSTISSTATVGGTFTISNDFELNLPIETGSDSISIVLKNGTQIERMIITATGGTATIVARGITQSEILGTDVTLQKQWTEGTLAYITALAPDFLDWLVAGYTTAQRTALVIHSGTSRIILNTDSGVLEQYIGGSWQTFGTGTTPNASTTVAGKVEVATDAEVLAGTVNGWSGAPLSINPSSTSATAVAHKVPVLDASGTIAPFVPPTLVPAGIFLPYGGASAPSGWILCDGSAVSRTTYAGLFTAISTAYGVGDGSTTFNVPDLRGRIPVGKNAGTFPTLGGTGGEETHVLTTPEMPAHTHTVSAWQSGFQGGTGATDYLLKPSVSITSGSTGGGTAHNNLQPYVVSNYIIKI